MRLMSRSNVGALAVGCAVCLVGSCGGGEASAGDALEDAKAGWDASPEVGADAGADAGNGNDAGPEVDTDAGADAGPDLGPNPGIEAEIYAVAGGCYALELRDGRRLEPADDGAGFAFAAVEADQAAAFRLRPTDLGETLFYDAERHYLVAVRDGEGEDAAWRMARTDDEALIAIPITEQRSDAEWGLASSGWAVDSYHLRHLNSGLCLGTDEGLVPEDAAAAVWLVPREGCVDYPELSLDAQGEVRREPWEDGEVFGVADIHEHVFIRHIFGGGGVFHGSTFHRLGVEHALGDCEEHHGPGGDKDIVGYVFHGDWTPEPLEMLSIIAEGSVGKFVHHTDGYPTFTDWPNARRSGTHTATYYRWLERAWMGGLRLIVNLETGNSVLCGLAVGLGTQEAPLGCDDMDSVDRGIASARALERYVDALAGGPGKGWLRIVESPAQAREVIGEGKLAMVLGIEISNLFDCFLTPPPGKPACDADLVREQVAEYHAKGVRIVFPVHKYDNGFAPGDGHRGPIELGNILNTGHYSNYVPDCPGIGGIDHGSVIYGGLNKPRDVYDAPPVLDMTALETDLMDTVAPLLPDISAGALVGEYCQNGPLTAKGEVLFDELMGYGMVIDVAHMPQWALVRALEILDEHEYPKISTHGNSFAGEVYRHGGVTNAGLGRCGNPDAPGQMIAGYLAGAAALQAANGLVAQPLGFDFNGLAGGPGPRFGDDSGCAQPQANPVTYPFTSYGGQVTFTEPHLGERTVDFNTEGMLHIGLLPEYIEDVRRDGATDEQLEPLFRTAEVFLKVWERADDKRTR